MSFNDLIHKYKLKNKATSNIKLYEVLKKISLGSKVGIYLRDGNLSTNCGGFNLHPSEGTHWVWYIKDCYFDSCGCPLPKKLPNFLKSRHVNVKLFFSELRVQKKAIVCLYKIY